MFIHVHQGNESWRVTYVRLLEDLKDMRYVHDILQYLSDVNGYGRVHVLLFLCLSCM